MVRYPPQLSTPLRHVAALLQNSMVLIAGGYQYQPSSGTTIGVTSAELYNPATGAFTPTGANLTDVGRSATLLNNGNVLMFGVIEPQQLYEPAAGTFATAGSSVLPRTGHTATLLNDGTVLVAGGSDGLLRDPDTTGAEIYDSASGTFAATGSLNTGSGYHTATLMTNGKVLIAGGVVNPYDGAFLARAELYDPVAKTFALTGTLAGPRDAQTATLLNDSTVLVVGGQDTTGSDEKLGTAELFNSSNQTFTGDGSLAIPRAAHTATLLNDGTVLIVGGINFGSGTLSSAELYATPLPPPASLQITPATVTNGAWRNQTVHSDRQSWAPALRCHVGRQRHDSRVARPIQSDRHSPRLRRAEPDSHSRRGFGPGADNDRSILFEDYACRGQHAGRRNQTIHGGR
jgi:hypothetical protein